MSEIERCPFCGKQPDLVSRAGAAGYRCSGKEPEHFVHSYGATEDEALAAWNTRSQPERVSRLEEALKAGAVCMSPTERVRWIDRAVAALVGSEERS